MSRCYPFPPPGYEKKTRAEDLDLLKKEKHREKKHRKDKKDKEKKEGKEKREKDRSDEKQREKKEKKEKHRDKKKDREKNRDKDKNDHVVSDDKRLLGNAEADKGEKDFAKSKEREKEKSTVSSDKVIMGYPAVYNGVVVGKNSHLPSENKNFKQLHELGNKIAVEEGKRINPLAEKNPSMEMKRDVGMPRMGVSTPATPMATLERNKERKVSDGKMDSYGPGVERRPVENLSAQKFTGMAQNRDEGVARQVEKNTERRLEMKVKITGIEGDSRKGEKRKEEDREKSIEKYKERDKKIKVERPKDTGGEMLVEQSRMKDNNKVQADLLRRNDGNKKDLLLAQSTRPAKLGKEDNKAAAIASPEILKKRKEFAPNGVLHEGDVGPNKKARVMFSSLPVTENGRKPSQDSTTVVAPVKQQALSNAKQDEGDVRLNKTAKITSSPLPLTENGRSLQPSQDPTAFSSAKQQAVSNAKLDHKDRRINGTINPLPPASKASQAAAPADRNPGAVKKSPHPDTKYLAQILLVPKVEEWSEFDEQEWLFSNSHSQQNKPKAETSRVDDTTPQVWAEPLRIESADVFALPYVIPR